MHQAVKNSHKTSVYRLGYTTAVSIFRKVEKNKKELKPYKIKVLALFFYKQEKARYLLLHFLSHYLSKTTSFSFSIGDFGYCIEHG
ncbi:hypothetical protein AACA89_05200 [Enterococcus faecalis]|nr:hypothetical protein [Enterococcus faecalis]MCT9927809.1 hypothetical protein [Enterococcus faecalis]MDH4720755.1 hypothetical protein [Enterococcus faecalis]MDJ9037144.1 hypothetical protein [Enterococcus faecalis]